MLGAPSRISSVCGNRSATANCGIHCRIICGMLFYASVLSCRRRIDGVYVAMERGDKSPNCLLPLLYRHQRHPQQQLDALSEPALGRRELIVLHLLDFALALQEGDDLPFSDHWRHISIPKSALVARLPAM
jgi:hypothetical protein